ncbi:MAG: esterase family protein [Christensenellaceae bacterium]|jgi:S-formylglutathione hydrolase FrmB|nr:esterase family protein [Christensenellaceae bacterium]
MKKIIAVLFLTVTVFQNILAAKTDFVLVRSESMEKEIPVIVISPNDTSTKASSIYLLHGYGDTETSFPIIKPELPEISDKHGIVFVIPRGGKSWYLDSLIDTKAKYETFIAKDLVKYIDKNYNTINNRKGRAITGFSMGGYGALFVAIKNKGVFGAAGSMSGAFDIPIFGSAKQSRGFGIPKILGDDKIIWGDYNITKIVDTAKLKDKDLSIIFDVGYNDNFLGLPIYEMNEALHKQLTISGISHDFFLYPGEHTMEYWKNAIDYQILFFRKFFEETNNTSKQ